MHLSLIALEPLPRGDWLKRCLGTLRGAGLSAVTRGHHVVGWGTVKSAGRVAYADGCRVERLWLGPRRWAAGVIAQRIYFRDDGVSIDDRQEHLIVGRNRPGLALADAQIAWHWDLLEVLRKGFAEEHGRPVALDWVDRDLSKRRLVYVGTVARDFGSSLNDVYRKLGFDAVPSGSTVTVCPVDGVPGAAARDFARRLEDCARHRHAHVSVLTSTIRKIEQRLLEIAESGESVRAGHCVLFLLPAKGCAASGEVLGLFGALESAGVPFRRAYADDPFEYSIPDQLPSLLIAANGRPHRSPTSKGGRPVWTIGVDLGHPAGRLHSVLVVTLVDPEGSLVGAWAKCQARDETARSGTLQVLLERCGALLYSRESSPQIVVLRDGRVFENEVFGLYCRCLKGTVSLFECRKRDSPQVVALCPQPKPIREPLAAIVPGTTTMFVATAPPRDQHSLLGLMKVSWRPQWNGLGMKPGETAQILAASACAPGLGSYPRRLPAAIYWADGIAGASDSDLRFRGIPVVRVD